MISQRVYTKEYLVELAKQVKSRSEFRKLHPGAYVAVYTRGWKEEVFGHLKRIRSKSYEVFNEDQKILIINKIKELLISKEISTSLDLKKNHPLLYHYYYKYEIHKSCSLFNKKNIWTKKQCHQAAKKCLSRMQFQTEYRAIYMFASRRKWLPKICSHMTKGKRVNYREQVCRDIFESHFKLPFPSTRPKWLRNPLTGYLLELDGYCEQLGLAFEYNGRVHYDKDHPNYKATKRRDKIKRKICQKLGIKLITINAFKLEKIKSSSKNKIAKLDLDYHSLMEHFFFLIEKPA